MPRRLAIPTLLFPVAGMMSSSSAPAWDGQRSVGRFGSHTIIDGLPHASRRIMLCEALEATREIPVIEAFECLFAEHGLPGAMRSDNGLPFASPNGLYNLSKLSVGWLRLGIAIERIKPACPQQNGRHERMQLTLKQEAARQHPRPAGKVRYLRGRVQHRAPARGSRHEGPADIYRASPRPYKGLPEVTYPFHDRDILVTACGRICMARKKACPRT